MIGKIKLLVKTEIKLKPKTLLFQLLKLKTVRVNQSDFRANHSTDACAYLSQLSTIIWKGAEKDFPYCYVLTDLQKAFDNVDHLISLRKMNCIGFSETSSGWFKYTLTARTFFASLFYLFYNWDSLHAK